MMKEKLCYGMIVIILNESIIQFAMTSLLFIYEDEKQKELFILNQKTENFSYIVGWFCIISCFIILPLLLIGIMFVPIDHKMNTMIRKIIGEDLLKNIKVYDKYANAYSLVYYLRRIVLCTVSFFFLSYPC